MNNVFKKTINRKFYVWRGCEICNYMRETQIQWNITVKIQITRIILTLLLHRTTVWTRSMLKHLLNGHPGAMQVIISIELFLLFKFQQQFNRSEIYILLYFSVILKSCQKLNFTTIKYGSNNRKIRNKTIYKNSFTLELM